MPRLNCASPDYKERICNKKTLIPNKRDEGIFLLIKAEIMR